MQRAAFLTLPLAALVLALATPAWALYKVVGPDGRITYTDRAPSDRPAQALKANGASESTEGLPFELQRIVARYPVTLYTSTNCTPCETGRQLLKTRGVPFVEKTVGSADDIKAFARLENTDQLPVVRIGQKQIQGFSQADWVSYLDAAGYPVKSALPLNYRWPAPAPLVPPPSKVNEPSASDSAGRSSAPSGIPTEPSGSAPSGFRF
jgi:glutaredoxin